MSHDTANMLRTTDTTAIHTAVVNTRIARCGSHNSTCMAISILNANTSTLDNHILDGCTISIGDERCRYTTERLVNLTFDNARKWRSLGTDRARGRESIAQHIVATHGFNL